MESEADLECQTQARESEVAFIREQNQLEILKAKELSGIEVLTLGCMNAALKH